MNAQTDLSSLLTVSDAAAARVLELVAKSANPDLKLRIFITGGGCSGFQYGLTFDQGQKEDDTLVEQNGIALLIDTVSYQYPAGANIDFVDALDGSRFVIENPNATTTCGCGSSFSI
ncbi:iron-sulfur cluster insertion protein ErpA [uncultured Thiodictyon sp.]|uniref:iron-sulfur cluster insertion protein ErpA n=1 Tax=uncultured Thiodictyon sp. TaxID=1846217 RepID=UPI0025EE5DAE|nr:iron-sulfur cluster insertion protein ErpA [uncultured Thiodictyon sp.]